MRSSPELHTAAIRIRSEIAQAINVHDSLTGCLENCIYGVFIKSIDDTMVVTNRVYDRLFLKGCPAAGRHATSYLDEGLRTTARLTDQLIRGNCTSIEFEHVEAVGDREVELQTVKLPLEGIGHPTFSVLGVTKLVREQARSGAVRAKSLKQCLQQLEAFDEHHREYVVLASKGATTQEIADALGCCRRTIEKYKKRVLDALGLKNTTQLAQLACRLQDAGFGEFGVFELERASSTKNRTY